MGFFLPERIDLRKWDSLVKLSRMQAIVQTDFGPPADLTFAQADTPEPDADQVRVRVSAAGVGFVDGLLIQGKYQIKPRLPYHPGSEFMGVVEQTGPAVTSLAIGDRVMGLGNGTFSEQLCLPASACIAVPEAMQDVVAGGFVLNYATALYGLRNCGGLLADETLLVLGASGGVGSAAISVAKSLGARVIAAASSEHKLAHAPRNGADTAVNYSDPGWRDALKTLLPPSGLNLVYDPVGGAISEAALRCLSPGGRHLVVGFAAGDIPRIPLNLPLLKQCAIVGVDWGGASRTDPTLTPALVKDLLQWFNQGLLQPTEVSVRPMREVREALADQLAGKVLGKLVLSRAAV